MACYKLLIQPTAVKEFDDIVAYISQYSENAALQFKKDWYACIDSLKEGIIEYRLSRFDNLAGAGYHSLLFGDYVILYFQTDNTRTIAHIFHQKQDYANLV